MTLNHHLRNEADAEAADEARIQRIDLLADLANKAYVSALALGVTREAIQLYIDNIDQSDEAVDALLDRVCGFAESAWALADNEYTQESYHEAGWPAQLKHHIDATVLPYKEYLWLYS